MNEILSSRRNSTPPVRDRASIAANAAWAVVRWRGALRSASERYRAEIAAGNVYDEAYFERRDRLA